MGLCRILRGASVWKGQPLAASRTDRFATPHAARLPQSTHYRILALTIAALAACANAAPATRPADAVVLLISNSPAAKGIGHGFFVGDGSLVVTARHLLYQSDHDSPSESLSLLTLLSPYLGDACEGRLVVDDVDADIAVLRCAWKNHPALQLADDQAIKNSDAVDVFSWNNVAHIIGEKLLPLPATFEPLSAQLTIDYIGLRHGELRAVALKGESIVRQGWSGSPVMLRGTNQCAAMVDRMSDLVGETFRRGDASAVVVARKLIENAKLADALKPAEPMARPADADRIFRLNIEARIAAASKQMNFAKQKYTELLKARPENPTYASGVASFAGELHDNAQADKLFQAAMQLDPHSLDVMVFYQQFLVEQKRYDDAKKILQQLRDEEPRGSLWALAMFNILDRQEAKPEEFVKVAEDGLKISPNDGLLWLGLGQTQQKLGDQPAAVKSLRRAVELNPQAYPAQMLLAQSLMKTNEHAKAEQIYRDLIKQHPQVVFPRVMLAQCLASQEKFADAIKEIQAAQAMPGPSEVPRESMAKIEAKFREQMKTLGPGGTTKPASRPSEGFHL